MNTSHTSTIKNRSGSIALFTALAAGILVSGCNREPAAPPRTQAPAATTQPQTSAPQQAGVVIDDTAITAQVKTQLLADESVKGMAVNVDTQNGVVTLSGQVAGGPERDKAVQVARSVSGVRSVVDSMVVN